MTFPSALEIFRKYSYLHFSRAITSAAAVFRMFFHTLTEATFNEGMRIYLSRSTSNPEGVVVPEHLYRALQQAVDEKQTFPEDFDNIQMLFESWEVNAGYPIVYVERSYNDRRIRFVQVR